MEAPLRRLTALLVLALATRASAAEPPRLKPGWRPLSDYEGAARELLPRRGILLLTAGPETRPTRAVVELPGKDSLPSITSGVGAAGQPPTADMPSSPRRVLSDKEADTVEALALELARSTAPAKASRSGASARFFFVDGEAVRAVEGPLGGPLAKLHALVWRLVYEGRPPLELARKEAAAVSRRYRMWRTDDTRLRTVVAPVSEGGERRWQVTFEPDRAEDQAIHCRVDMEASRAACEERLE